MKLERIHLHDFRCFDQLTVEFDPKLTVIIAENGAGKTTLLDAIATGFGRYLTKLGKKGQALRQSDIQVTDNEKLAPFVGLTLETTGTHSFEPNSLVWSLTRKRDPASKITTPFPGTKALDDFAFQLLAKQASGNAFLFPLIVYYGTNRAILDDGRQPKSSRKKLSPLDALDGALESKARFHAAFEWFKEMEDEERRERELRRNFEYRLPPLQYVRRTVETAFLLTRPPGQEQPLPVLFENLRTEKRPTRFVIDRLLPNGVTRTLQISQLSDGYRTLLGLVMDLARRQAQAFSACPGVMAGFHTVPTIVLIDEIDLHLHPVWQQTVLSNLRRVFRSTQFIVTTHSPQVLTTVPSESIRILSDGQVFGASPGTEGAESSRLLKRVFGVDPRPPHNTATKRLNDYLKLVYADKWDALRAKRLRKLLNARYQGEEPALTAADLHIENQKWEQESSLGGSVEDRS